MPSLNLNLKKIFDSEIIDNKLKDIAKIDDHHGEKLAICDKPSAENGLISVPVESTEEVTTENCNNKSDNKIEEIVENKEAQDDKKKLVLRFSLSKSFDDQVETTEPSEAETSLANQNITGIASRLLTSRAFNRFIQSALYRQPENSDIKDHLRAADTQRLVNSHQSRENSPEPGIIILLLFCSYSNFAHPLQTH